MPSVDCIPHNLIHMYKMHVPTVALWLKGGINHDPTWLRSATCGKGCVPHFVAVNFVCHCLATWVGVPDLLTLVAERFRPPTWLSCSLATPAWFVEILEFLAVVLTGYGDYTCGSWW